MLDEGDKMLDAGFEEEVVLIAAEDMVLMGSGCLVVGLGKVTRCVVPACAFRFVSSLAEDEPFTPARIAGAPRQAGAVLLSHMASLGGARGTTPLKQPQPAAARAAGTR